MTTFELVFAWILFIILIIGFAIMIWDIINTYHSSCKFYYDEETEKENTEKVLMEINNDWKHD